MNRYLLLIFLSSWAHVVPLSSQCETGVAYPKHELSVPRSLMANADVAILKTYHAETLDKCITACCGETYGACTVASFKKDFNGSNCQHFNCRPVEKCKFLSSNLTDSFSFTSSSSPHILVPSRHASKNESSTSTVPSYTTKKSKLDQLFLSEQTQGITKEAIATYSEDELAYKDDNTTIKPRKGVDDGSDNSFENVTRSSIKPRKGVNLDIVNSESSKSKVKPRKGVGPYQSHSSSSSEINLESTTQQVHNVLEDVHSSSSLTHKTFKDLNADDLVAALQKVFEDDSNETDIKPSTTISSATVATDNFLHSSSFAVPSFIPTSTTTVQVTSSLATTSSPVLQSSLSTTYVKSSSAPTPGLTSTSAEATEVVNYAPMPSSSSPTVLEHSKLLFQALPADEGTKMTEIYEAEDLVESENERKYKSSMHLVLSLVFGLLVLFSVLGVVAKRVYDGWLRRHYRRMDFLIDGMYNGYG